uniref:Uncharacterized protein n=1 Tax=Arundo donax TaxID=35708 RepID=A0A0A9CY45_ARUDO
MEKKCESLARITTILKDVIQNKDRIIARLQQPYSLDCIPVEAEYQVMFVDLIKLWFLYQTCHSFMNMHMPNENGTPKLHSFQLCEENVVLHLLERFHY